LFEPGTIYSNFTPLIKSPVIGYRISGPDVLDVLLQLTKKNFKNDHSRVRFVKLFDLKDNLIDECSVVFFKGPKSFTGEDVCEIFLHGSPLIASQLEQTFNTLNFSGLRLAKKGEFTYRSVLNAKNTLKQAKAINQIIFDDSFSSLEYNKKLLFSGDTSSGLTPLKEEIVNIFSEITASIDFVDDEEFNFVKIKKKIEKFFLKCNNILLKYKEISNNKDFCKIMLVGSVNVGKSTLFNKIIDQDRAIITNIKGTTRDLLSKQTILNGKKFEIFDTAGQRDRQGKIEKFGYQKAQKMASEIDHFLILVDKNTKKSDIKKIFSDFNIISNYTIIETKSDKYQYRSKNIKISHLMERSSLLKMIKLEKIHRKYIKKNVKKINFNDEESAFLSGILKYRSEIEKEMDILIIAHHIRNILDDFSYEFGYINNEDVYDRVFSSFCIGK
jgi:tRNA modification GTPase